jgi:hypothetical protein
VNLVNNMLEKHRSGTLVRFVNGIIKMDNYRGIKTAVYRGQKSPLMALMLLNSFANRLIALMDFHQEL